jgi:hypothetical protein
MNDMSDIVFKTTEDQQNFEKAKKLLKRTLKLFHADGGIGIAQDQHQKIRHGSENRYFSKHNA